MIATDDTIAAIASAPGPTARGLVRLSGPQTRGVLSQILEAGAPDGPASYARARLTPSVSLPVAVLAFRAPRSFTGEDAAEILTVGNPIVLERVLDACLNAGARRAAPGEFSARAYLAGKLTLQQAESINARIAAERDEDLEAADRVRAGAFGVRCAAWADRLAGLLALVEAGIDFTDQEDVVAITAEELREQLHTLARELHEAVGGGGPDERTARDPRVVLVGPPNAGKSTLFNALLGRSRSVVSDVAGTTRDAIEEPLDLGRGAVIRLIDLPGLDRAMEGGHGEPDAEGQVAARRAIDDADLLIACDPSGRFADIPTKPGRPIIRVRTKADLPTPRSSEGALAVCALDGWHLDALQRAIADLAERSSGGDAVVPRHRRSVRLATGSITDALTQLTPYRESTNGAGLEEPETIAACLRSALDELGAVAGQISPDEILGRVFASFCVGK